MTIVIAHVMFTVSYVVVTVRARLEGMDRHIEEAAMDLGATEWTTFRKITLPLIAPGVAAAALLAAAISIDDYVITNFNAGQTQTFPLFIFGATRQGVPAEVNVLATMLLLAVLVLMGLNLLVQQTLADATRGGQAKRSAGFHVEGVEAIPGRPWTRSHRPPPPGAGGVEKEDGPAERRAAVVGEQVCRRPPLAASTASASAADRSRGRVDAGDHVGRGVEALDDLHDPAGMPAAELEIVRADAEDAAALDRRRHTGRSPKRPLSGLHEVHRG